MPPSAEDRYRDILEAIARVETLWRNKTVVDFQTDEIGRMATERLLEIVCEASRRLPEEAKLSASEIDWRRIVDFGNLLRHAYHATAPGRVWTVVNEHLPPLKAFALRKLSEPET